jgi:hypothetical protein
MFIVGNNSNQRLVWLDRLTASGERTINYKTEITTPIQTLDFAAYVQVLTTKWRLLTAALQSQKDNGTIYMEGSLDHTTFFSTALQQTYTLTALEQSMLRELSMYILDSIRQDYFTADLVCNVDDNIKPFVHDSIRQDYFTAELVCDVDDDFIEHLYRLADV